MRSQGAGNVGEVADSSWVGTVCRWLIVAYRRLGIVMGTVYLQRGLASPYAKARSAWLTVSERGNDDIP
jgi:hypothetical protein